MRFLFALVICVQVYSVFGDCPTGLCPSDQTCCAGPAPGLYGCCPEPNAVCCSDGLHCCPANTVCDVEEGLCKDKNNQMIPFVFRKREQPEVKFQSVAMPEAQKAETVVCPGGASFCADSNTCCLLTTGQYGCCPYPSATCCADRVHCCPYGTRCDITSQYCVQGNSKLPVAPKRPRTPAFLL